MLPCNPLNLLDFQHLYQTLMTCSISSRVSVYLAGSVKSMSRILSGASIVDTINKPDCESLSGVAHRVGWF